MPKRNTSGPPRGRRTPAPNSGSKSRPDKSEDSSSKKTYRPRSEKPFRGKSSDETRPFQKPSGETSRFGKKGATERPRGDNSNRNFEKRERGQQDPASGKGKGRMSRSEGSSQFSSAPRSDRSSGKFEKDARPRSPKRASSFSGGSKEERPYKKFEKPGFNKKGSFNKDEKPAFKKSDSTGGDGPRFTKGKSSNPFFRKRDESAGRNFTKGEQPPRESRSRVPQREHSGDTERPAVRKEGFESRNEGRPESGKIRLNKFIANSGVCSRREADELIKMGLISVNGTTITELGYKVNPGDEVRHESKVLRAEKPVYILLNKPKGFITTTVDPQERRTVMHLVGNVVKERVYPVGRLDRNTTGLLLLTNDGELAERLMHPSFKVKKIYKVELDRPLTKADAQRIMEGVKLEEGRAMVDDLAIVSEDRKTVGIEIHIGWNRVVRRIFESMEYEVIKLDRTVYAGLNKKDLGRGEWRFLKKEELVLLKHF